jgi:hypothetical protein
MKGQAEYLPFKQSPFTGKLFRSNQDRIISFLHEGVGAETGDNTL